VRHDLNAIALIEEMSFLVLAGSHATFATYSRCFSPVEVEILLSAVECHAANELRKVRVYFVVAVNVGGSIYETR